MVTKYVRTDPREVAEAAIQKACKHGFGLERNGRNRICAEDVAGIEAVIHAELWLALHRRARVKVNPELEELGPGKLRVRYELELPHGEAR